MIATNSTVYVWGRTEMLPSYNATDLPGATGSWSKTFDGDIIKITAGSNGFAVLYKTRSAKSSYGTEFFRVNKTFIWTRKNENYYGLATPDIDDLSEFGYSDISFGYSHAIALKYGDVVSPLWNYSDFQDPTSKIAQFNAGSGNIPRYFKRQAFFRAVPGGWDFSKWIYGGYCLDNITNDLDPLIIPDPCSILGYNVSGEEDKNWQFSGNPQYWWMNSYIRRYQMWVANHSVELDDPPSGICKQYLSFGQQSAIALDNGSNAMNSICPEKADVCWQATGMPLASNSVTWAPESSGCAVECQPSCEGGTCVRPCCPGPNQPFVSSTCINSVGKIGFISNKDYFIQSYKQFTRIRGCCKTYMTNISYFTYSQKLSYYGYDESSATYKVFITPDPYRWEGNKPSNALDVYTYNNFITYPYVYLGGKKLEQLQYSYWSSVWNIGNGKPCDGNGTYGCQVANPGLNILGQGGWLWFQPRDGTDYPLGWTDGKADSGIRYYQTNAPVSPPWKFFGEYTSGTTGNPWGGAYVPFANPQDEQQKILIFDIGNTYNYAPTYGSPLDKKWHLINAERPNIYQGVTFGEVAFQGMIGTNAPPSSAYGVVVTNTAGTYNIQSGNITCSAIQTEP